MDSEDLGAGAGWGSPRGAQKTASELPNWGGVHILTRQGLANDGFSFSVYYVFPFSGSSGPSTPFLPSERSP